MQQTHIHKAVTGRVEAKKLLSRRRQSEYSHIPRDTFATVSDSKQLSFTSEYLCYSKRKGKKKHDRGT